MEIENIICRNEYELLHITKRNVGMRVILNGVVLKLIRNPSSKFTTLNDWKLVEPNKSELDYSFSDKNEFYKYIISEMIFPIIKSEFDEHAKIKISKISTINKINNKYSFYVEYWVYDSLSYVPYSFSTMTFNINECNNKISLSFENEDENKEEESKIENEKK